jgi:hypothetical protein
MRKHFTDKNGESLYVATYEHMPHVIIGGYSGPLSFDYDLSFIEARKLGEFLISITGEAETEVKK